MLLMLPSRTFLIAVATSAVLMRCVDEVQGAYNFVNIADTTTVAPSGTFQVFDQRPAISGSTVAFYAQYPNSGYGGGIFTGSGGPVTTVAKPGDPAPIAGKSFIEIRPPAISGGNVAFVSNFCQLDSNNACVDDVRGGVFSGGGSSVVAVDDEPADNFFFKPAIDGSNVVFERGYGGFLSNDRAILLGNTTIVRTGDSAPIGSFNGTFGGDYFGPSAAVSGTTAAFWARYGDGSSSGEGIFNGNGGPLTTIAKTGDPAPAGGQFTSFAPPAISGNTTTFYGISDFATHAIYTAAGGSLTTIVQSGDPAPGGGVFGNFVNGGAISGNTIAFIGAIGAEGYGIFIANGTIITKVIRPGDSLFGSVVQDYGLSFDIFGLDPNGSGNIAFWYSLADGRTGIAMATPVPEPACLTLACLGFLTGAMVKRQRTRRPHAVCSRW